MKALACDFDGTFYFPNQPEQIKKGDVEAIKAFQTHGHLFGFCTGRPIYGLLDYLNNQVAADFYILNSGATIFDKDLNLIYEKTISNELAKTLVTYGKEQHYDVDFHMDGKFYFFGKSNRFIKDEIYSLDEIDGKVHTITYDARTEENAEELLKNVTELFSEQVAVYRNTRYVDIVPLGCSKGFGIDFVRNTLKPALFAGIGDSMNDAPMFDKVDLSFTFSYAPNALKEKADHLVESVEKAIYQLI